MIGEYVMQYLADNMEGTFYLGFRPDKPSNVIVIYEETAPVLPESSAFAIDTAGIQLLVRHDDYSAAKAKLKEAHKLLAAFRGQLTEEAPKVRETYVTTTPSAVGSDEENRKLWTAHYAMTYNATETQFRTQT